MRRKHHYLSKLFGAFIFRTIVKSTTDRRRELMNDLASRDSCASFQLNTAKGNESQYFIIDVNESRGQDTVSLCSALVNVEAFLY